MAEKVATTMRQVLEILVLIFAIGGPTVGAIMYFATLGPSMSDQGRRLEKVEIHVEQMAESRTVGLQRLAANEEATKALKSSLDVISAKLDRLLFERRR